MRSISLLLGKLADSVAKGEKAFKASGRAPEDAVGEQHEEKRGAPEDGRGTGRAPVGHRPEHTRAPLQTPRRWGARSAWDTLRPCRATRIRSSAGGRRCGRRGCWRSSR